MFSGIRSVISFLTLIPAGGTSLETAAKHMYAFPLVGIVLGAVLGAFGFGLSEAGLEPAIAALLVVAAIAIVTGIHHTDGLGDFADGLMVKGTRERKLSAMRDASVGSAGVLAIVLYAAGMILALSLTGGWHLFLTILVAEVAAKFSMVLMASLGRPAAPGTSSPFLQVMKDWRRLALAGAITAVPVILLGGVPGVIALGAVIAVTLFLTRMASRSLGGVTGDVLGAANEISRLAAVLVLVSA